ncbi:MAG: dienelactone hydrolase family protein [Smithellaceae bacterium]|nr:dienelactone hydrolase family protein [Smithellaceae bacterium]
MKYLLSLIIVVLCASAASADTLRTKVVEYSDQGAVMAGYLAYDSAFKGPRPGVLVAHEWWGLNDYIRSRADQLARLGYVAFAADIYGKGNRAKTPAEAAALAGRFVNDRPLVRSRIKAALAVLKNEKLTAGQPIAAIGYCFGGMTVLELARSGADIAGVVSFHGTLDTPNVADAKNIRAKVLVLQGADDPYVPAAKRITFEDEMRMGGVDWQMNVYGNTVHSFTNPASGDDPTKGVAYNQESARRSWEAMQAFFKEIFAKPGK